MISRLIHTLLALLLLAVPAFGQAASFTGTVTYRERIAAPAGTTLRVSLVTLPSGRPVAGATGSVAANGHPPIGFVLNLRTDVSRHGTALGLVAELNGPGGFSFASVAPVPVDASAPTPVSIELVRVPAATQKSLPPAAGPRAGLAGVLWRITSIGGKPAVGERAPTFSITTDNRAGGNSGCNNYFAEADFTAGLSFGPTAATRMACSAPLMEQEAALFAALAAVTRYESDGDSLRLLDAAGIPLIGLVPLEE
jgi:putative lipoprotein